MLNDHDANGLPAYESGPNKMSGHRTTLASQFAKQILETARPYLPVPDSDLNVLDIGCGYGYTTVEMSRVCRRAVGIEPSPGLYAKALALQDRERLDNLEFRRSSIQEIREREAYDLVVLDNVLEHLPDHDLAFSCISDLLRPGGVVFILVPNKLWPLEVHYGLPLLSYLPLTLANSYLRFTGRGYDYTDASYAPTYWGLNRLARRHHTVRYRYVLPADVTLATHGTAWHYQVGVRLIRRFPWLWAVSKNFLLIGVKNCVS